MDKSSLEKPITKHRFMVEIQTAAGSGDDVDGIAEILRGEGFTEVKPIDGLRAELAELRSLDRVRDAVDDHIAADRLLLEYIGDDEVRASFDAIDKFYE